MTPSSRPPRPTPDASGPSRHVKDRPPLVRFLLLFAALLAVALSLAMLGPADAPRSDMLTGVPPGEAGR